MYQSRKSARLRRGSLIGAALWAAVSTLGVVAAQDAPPRTIELWMFLGNTSLEGQAMTELAAAFEQRRPGVDVHLQWGVNLDKLTVGVLAGLQPNIVQVQGDWVNSLALQGILAPVDGFLKQAGFSLEAYWPPLLAQLEYQGRHYGLPWTVNAHFALWWNKQVLSEAGADPDHSPPTLTALAELHHKLTRVSADGSIERLGFVPWGTGHFANAQYFWSGYFGSAFYDENAGRFRVNDAGGIEALEWMLGFLTDFTLSQSMQRPFWPPSSTEPVGSGRTAMFPAVPPWVTNAVRQHPDVSFGVDLMPLARPGGPRGEFLAGAVLAVPSTVSA
ncbi:MAG TPA: extracellular solute-binding protein, partial [Limnochordia bacterium]